MFKMLKNTVLDLNFQDHLQGADVPAEAVWKKKNLVWTMLS